jgi:hypothetical protein
MEAINYSFPKKHDRPPTYIAKRRHSRQCMIKNYILFSPLALFQRDLASIPVVPTAMGYDGD